ncbi:MAG: DNA-directed DNA polymerase II small subunit [Candidatus ainarchaeum sp.]|nr:DNA-directed DNA polymerase II small subunit [Candidatus ainarchaeum sp.]
MVDEEIVGLFAAEGLLVSPEALEFLKGLDEPLAFASRVAGEARKRGLFVVERNLVEELAELKEDEKIPVPAEVSRAPDWKPLAREWGPDLRFFDSTDVSRKSRCKGKVEDFVAYFRDRLARTRKIIEARGGGGNGALSTKALPALDRGRELRVIGLVKSKRPTKKGDLLVEVEDEEGVAKVWIGKGRNEREQACFRSAAGLLLDEAVAVDGRWSDPFVIAVEIVWPDVPVRAPKRAEKDVAVAFLSDLHVGSKLFLEKEFASFIRWINGGAETREGREIAGRIKYLVVAGDIVDGIGIYPRQEKELLVRDIFEQYRICGKFLAALPDYVEVVVAPGNHDAVRRAEPQPGFSGEIADALGGGSNLHLVGSPSFAEIEGFSTLIYHGTSLDSIIAALPGMSYARPEKPMCELVRRRHLSPLFGENLIVPEQKDYMLIEKLPDIVHMGHVHKNGYEAYRGILMVNSGTWQARTEFQAKQGHMPSPGILPVYDLRKGDISAVRFADEAKAGAEGGRL